MALTTIKGMAALAAGVLAFTVSSTFADEIRHGDLVISQAWSRATPNSARVAGGYLLIENKGNASDTLKGGSTEIAGKTEVHEMTVANGVMTMRPLEAGLTIPAGKTVTLAPGGYHMMFMDLRQPLKEGSRFSVTLEFEKAGKATVPFAIESVGAKQPHGAHGAAPEMKSSAPPAMDHGKMKM